MGVRWIYGCSLNYNAVEVLLFGSIRAILVLPERQLPLRRKRAKPYQIPSPFREFEPCYSGHNRTLIMIRSESFFFFLNCTLSVIILWTKRYLWRGASMNKAKTLQIAMLIILIVVGILQFLDTPKIFDYILGIVASGFGLAGYFFTKKSKS